MGFSEEMERIEAERISAITRANGAAHALAGHAPSVIREIEQSVSQAVGILRERVPHLAGYLVAQELVDVPEKRGLFGKASPAGRRADGYLAGRFWSGGQGWVITDGNQILRASVYRRSRGAFIFPETAVLSRSLGIPEGTDVAVTAKGNEAPRRLDAAHLILAAGERWTGPTEFVGLRWWECTAREPSAAVLDSNDWASRGSGFGITPEGKAGLVSVQEQEHFRDGASFSMTMSQLDKWLARFVQQAINGE